jgi:hypothetical protein
MRFVIAFLASAAACASPPQRVVALSRCAAGPLADTLSPSRDAFFREALFASPTMRTPRFDDYTPDSYHADKLDLAEGLPSEAARCGLRLRALLVVGPVGPLWSFHVVPFIEDGDSLRVNSLVMPHARITGKGSARVSEAALTELVTDLTRSPLVKAGLPAFGDSLREPLARDFSYNLLLVLYEGEHAPRYWHASLWPAMRGDDKTSVEHAERLTASIDRVLGRTSETYTHGMDLERRALRP